jgi:hypothetical protein
MSASTAGGGGSSSSPSADVARIRLARFHAAQLHGARTKFMTPIRVSQGISGLLTAAGCEIKRRRR